MPKETIDITPTWRALLPVLLEVYANSGDAGRKGAWLELVRMANAADAAVAAEKALKVDLTK